jgi:hypothetical protein
MQEPDMERLVDVSYVILVTWLLILHLTYVGQRLRIQLLRNQKRPSSPPRKHVRPERM